MHAALTRRSALAAAVALITCRAAPVAAAPIYAAIRRAEAADAADRKAGRYATALHRAGRPVPAGWKSYRAGLRQARTAARFDLHSLTPSTAEAATALVAYYRVDQRSLRHQALRAGATDFLGKPCEPVEIQARITNVSRHCTARSR